MQKLYPSPRTGLVYETPFQLLVATILSAQTTDRQVNRVTKRLFKDFTGPEDFASLKPEQLQPYIRSLGLYQNKSKYIIESSKKLIKKFSGKVPRTRKELMALPGVGRKTANVVLANAFKIPALAVDTHVFRVARRLGLTQGNTPIKVEKDLMETIPGEKWIDFHHWLIALGRDVCKAGRPLCDDCVLKDLCLFNQGKGGEMNEQKQE